MSRARVVAALVFFAVFAAGCSRTSSQPQGKDAVPGAPGNIEGRGRWVRTAGKYGSSNTWSSPFQANISAKGREGLDVGEDVEVTVSLHNVTSVPSSREAPRALEVMEYAPTVAAFPASGSIDSPIWEATLPPLSGVLEPGDGYELNLAWKQVDSSGGRVPPGYYYVELKSGSVRYRDDGREKAQVLEWSMHTSHSEVQINHPEGTTVSGAWKINRSVTEDGVTVTLKEIEAFRNYSLFRFVATSKKPLSRIVGGIQCDFVPVVTISDVERGLVWGPMGGCGSSSRASDGSFAERWEVQFHPLTPESTTLHLEISDERWKVRWAMDVRLPTDG